MKKVEIGNKTITIEDICLVSRKEASLSLSKDPNWIKRMLAGPAFLEKILQERGNIYGVTTGYGDSCDKEVAKEHYHTLPLHLTRFHGCGLGDHFDAATTRAIIAVRLNSLGRGYSGVTMGLMDSLMALIEHDILPLVPQEGSVGASGDLTPLSYIAAAIVGERNVSHEGKVISAAEALAKFGLKPIRFQPKEGLAIMNGTAVMTAVACLAFERADYLANLCCRLTAMVSLALKGNAYHFDERLFEAKPHPGQIDVARKIRLDLGEIHKDGIMPHRLQDPYSVRCAPHIIGVFFDASPMLRQFIENELNSANDNPIIDPDSSSIMHGGHFYGGHIAFAMDSLKNIVANLADLLDRQLAVLVDEKFNRGLPPNLSGKTGEFAYNHGFKAVQIGASAWTAEALKNTMPASVFSRSTECHNQDKVSMGTIAARDCIRVLELTEQVAAACLLAFTQALWLRQRAHQIKDSHLAGVLPLMNQVGSIFELVEDDRPLESDLRQTIDLIRSRHWEVLL